MTLLSLTIAATISLVFFAIFPSSALSSNNIDKEESIINLTYYVILQQNSMFGIDERLELKFSPYVTTISKDKAQDFILNQLANPPNQTQIVRSIVENATNGMGCNGTLVNMDGSELSVDCQKEVPTSQVLLNIFPNESADKKLILLNNTIAYLDNSTRIGTVIVGP